MNFYSPATSEILGISEILERHRNTSFAAGFPPEDLEPLGYFRIVERPENKPLPDYTKNFVLDTPALENGEYVEQWKVLDASQEEIDLRTADSARDIRRLRNQRLADCDWTQLTDAPVDAAAWAGYRQALRDITGQAGFPWHVQWPERP
jgi:hypothetical protein